MLAGELLRTKLPVLCDTRDRDDDVALALDVRFALQNSEAVGNMMILQGVQKASSTQTSLLLLCLEIGRAHV